jgi:type II secretory pathway pseudopilin PulG
MLRRLGAEGRFSGRNDHGDTLVEIVITIGILGIVVASLLGGLVVSLGTSTVHRSLANLDTVVRSFAEQAERQLELGPNAGFQDCAQVGGTSYHPQNPSPPATTISYTLPAGYTVTFTSIQYWNGSTEKFDPPAPPWGSPNVCPATDQSGYQLLTVQGIAPSGAAATMSFAVRAPA